jgi:hypothetical protein
MIVYLLLLGGLLYGTAAFAGGPVYALAGVLLLIWLAVTIARRFQRTWRHNA